MKKNKIYLKPMLGLFLFGLFSSISSCDNSNDDENTLLGIWNVTDTYDITCDGVSETKMFTYQITIDQWKEDSIIITNMNEETSMYGIYSGNSIVATQVGQSSNCEASGIVNGTNISFTLNGYECDNGNLYQYLNNNCTPSNSSIDNRNLTAAKN